MEGDLRPLELFLLIQPCQMLLVHNQACQTLLVFVAILGFGHTISERGRTLWNIEYYFFFHNFHFLVYVVKKK